METNEISEKVNAMWLALGEQIASAVPDLVISHDPVDAIRWATCAEACFWKATGDSSTHDVGDILKEHSVSESSS